MQVNIVEDPDFKIDQDFIQNWMSSLSNEIGGRTTYSTQDREITLAFVSRQKIQQLNHQFRHKNKPTDVLSFSGVEAGELGELALCGEILVEQARDHKLELNEELGYMLIHGVLHLLGYDHEEDGPRAKEMFQLQDEIFDVLRNRFF